MNYFKDFKQNLFFYLFLSFSYIVWEGLYNVTFLSSPVAGNIVLCEAPSTTLCQILIQIMSLWTKSLYFWEKKNTAARTSEFCTNQKVNGKELLWT